MEWRSQRMAHAMTLGLHMTNNISTNTMTDALESTHYTSTSTAAITFELLLVKSETDESGFAERIVFKPNEMIGRQNFMLPEHDTNHMKLAQISKSFFKVNHDSMVTISDDNKTDYQFVEPNDIPINIRTTPIRDGYMLKVASYEIRGTMMVGKYLRDKAPLTYRFKVTTQADPPAMSRTALQVKKEQEEISRKAMKKIFEQGIPFQSKNTDFNMDMDDKDTEDKVICDNCKQRFTRAYYRTHRNKCNNNKRSIDALDSDDDFL